NEAGVVQVRIRVQAPSKQVLTVVVNDLLRVRQVAVAGVEGLGKEQQVAKPIPVFGELSRMAELVAVAVGMIRPNVFDFEGAGAPALGVIDITGWHSGLRFDKVNHARNQAMDLATIGAVESKSGVRTKCFDFCV